jgi:hypothetical protein
MLSGNTITRHGAVLTTARVSAGRPSTHIDTLTLLAGVDRTCSIRGEPIKASEKFGTIFLPILSFLLFERWFSLPRWDYR